MIFAPHRLMVKVVSGPSFDEDMNRIELEGEELLARAFCHEIDHLDGHMYTEKVEGGLHDVGAVSDEDEE